MKIGILTLPLHTNYGGILQAYALQTALEKLGHEVQVINLDRTPRSYATSTVIKHFITLVLSSIKRRRLYKFYNIRKEEQNQYKDFLIKSKYTQKYIEKYIHNYWVRNYTIDIERSDFDAIVVGSDQIWNPIHAKSVGGVVNAYLPSLTGSTVRRISYAASFGKDTWEYSPRDTEIAKLAIREFTAVSVRETSGIKLCKDYLGVEATQQLDPTLLLEASDYKKLLSLDSVEKSNGDLLVYLLDSSKEKNEIVEYIEGKMRFKRFVVNSRAEDNNVTVSSIEECIQPPVEKWLRGFMDAKFVVTDSFHACVFSILFHKPFIVVGNEERGLTRFSALLEIFNMGERLVSNLQEVKDMDLSKDFDHAGLESVLKKKRIESLSFLKDSLS